MNSLLARQLSPIAVQAIEIRDRERATKQAMELVTDKCLRIKAEKRDQNRGLLEPISEADLFSNGDQSPQQCKPEWNKDRRELYFNGKLVLQR